MKFKHKIPGQKGVGCFSKKIFNSIGGTIGLSKTGLTGLTGKGGRFSSRTTSYASSSFSDVGRGISETVRYSNSCTGNKRN